MTTAKADTRVLLLAGDLLTDQSQRGQDLTAADAGSYEDASDRTALDGLGDGRTIEIVAQLSSARSGILINSGDAASLPTYRITATSGVLTFIVGGATIATITPPSLSGTDGQYLIAWATEPDATEADDLRSEIIVRGETGDIERVVVVHAADSSDPADPFSVGGLWIGGGSLSDDFNGTIEAVRVSSRFHTAVETREDWVEESDPDVDGWVVCEPQRLPASCVAVGSLAGPQWQAAAVAVREHRPRLASALVQALPVAPWAELGADITDVYSPKWVTEHGDDWQSTIAWLWWLEVPAACGWVVPHLQLATWSTNTDPPAQLQLRVVLSDAKPGKLGARSESLLLRSANDGASGPGELVQLPRALVRRDKVGRTWAWLEMRIVGANAAATSYTIRQVSLHALSVPSYSDPDEPLELWG